LNTQPTPPLSSEVDVHDAVKALAFVGDLSMGQPIDQSARTAWLAAQLAAALGHGAEVQANSRQVALLRWSGCTANAPEFAELMGDDVVGRQAMLAAATRVPPAAVQGEIGTLATVHCEVSGDVARRLGMGAAVEHALRNVFEAFDGRGKPGLRGGDEVPVEVYLVNAAGDLEIFSRVHGLERALRFIAARAEGQYPQPIADCLALHAADWLHSLERGAAGDDAVPGAVGAAGRPTAPLELIADVIDLKLPWLTGFSRKVASAACNCGVHLGFDGEQQQRIYRAGLIHGLGRASVSNTIWEAPGKPGEGAAEALRLVPYWTARAVRRIGSLSAEADIASFVDERLDGSGFFRGVRGDAISPEGQVLAAATHWTWLQTSRPGFPALGFGEASARMQSEVAQGRFAAHIVAALTGPMQAQIEGRNGPQLADTHSAAAASPPVLSSREIEVLSRISHGESNKEAARALGISPSTVRAHLENVFRKLGCTTRAAATLKAMHQGLFSPAA
jgi:HD-GYP domain-containing protein (c-di-GMP phosphodiesterase class II)/DNA-binding CsgD family transcriptional regulator